jgi:hypothetical protein
LRGDPRAVKDEDGASEEVVVVVIEEREGRSPSSASASLVGGMVSKETDFSFQQGYGIIVALVYS